MRGYLTTKKSFVFLSYLVFVTLSLWLMLLVAIYRYGVFDERQVADAIVVLGASQWNGMPSPVFEARLLHSYDLYNQGYAKHIILTGGIGDGELISESQVGKEYLAQKDIPEDSIFIEEIGRTSLQSLEQAHIILEEQNFNSILLVSDRFHMMRLHNMASDLGLTVYMSPTPYSPIERYSLTELKHILRESVVYFLYLTMRI
jgi:uncharacterized SAM-binding protein YcdF (DUF218 family)